MLAILNRVKKWRDYLLLKRFSDLSVLLNEDWYHRRYPETAGFPAIRHYVFYGAVEGKDPNPYFHTNWYLRKYPDVAVAGCNPLLHFVQHCVLDERKPNPYFDTTWYVRQYPQSEGRNPLAHYIEKWQQESLNPNPFFHTAWYAHNYSNAIEKGTEPLLHYLAFGAKEEKNPHPLFDSHWYLRQYPRAAECENPLLHFLLFGELEQLNPNPYFDREWYVNHYRLSASTNPFLHYLGHGSKNNPSPYFDTAWYLNAYPGIAATSINPLQHYIEYGVAEGRNPSRFFDTTYYLWHNPDVAWYGMNPLYHFLAYGQKEGKETQASGGIAASNILGGLVDTETVEPLLDPPGKIAIHAHIFYSDLASEFAEKLGNMPFDYHLFVSVTNDADKVLCGDVFSNLPHLSQLTIQVVPNRGRDIAPMICFFGNELKSFDFIGHIHSKKSLYNKGATDGWRQYLLDSLLGDSDRIRKIFSLLKQQAGMVYPQNFHLLPYLGYTWLANKSKGRAWCQRLGLSAFPEGYFDFPAGSMFFARSEVLHPLFEGNIQLEDFEPEGGQTDGTLAHTLERILGILVQSTGKPIAILRDDENSSWSRWRFDQFLSHSADSALALLQNPDIKLIVFDIFDTLLLRPLPDAELTKRIVAENAGGDLGKRYLRWRAAAEQEARAKTRKDVNLFQIMAEMRHLSGMSEEEERKLLNLELAIEYEIVSPREDLVWLFNQALLTGKKVVLASDMYLPKTHIENMLERCGIRGWHALYLSSDVNARKDTGKLYDHIIQVEQVHVSQIIAIGDNERSDVQIPCDMGTKSLHVLRPVELARAMPKLSSMVNYKLPQESLDYQISLGLFLRKNFAAVFYNGHFDYTSIVPSPSLESLGYSIVGPTLVSFVQWLLTTARKNRINHLFFLSREGEVMFEVYKKLKGVNPDIVDASYLVLSRRSVNIPAVSSLQDVFQIAQTSYGQDTLESFLFTRFGLTLTDEALEKYYAEGLWIKDQPVMVHDDDINALRPLLTALFPTIFEQGQKEKIALLAYLDSIGLTANDNCAIVDIGFPGTIQHRLNALLGGKIHGYYMLANQQAKIMAGSLDVQAEGCFYDGFDTNSKIPFLASQGFFAEKLLSSDSPQLLYYKLDTDHRIIPHYRSLTQEELATIPLRAEIRKGIMDYVEDVLWIKSAILKDFTVPSSFATRLFEDMFQQLSNTEYNIQKMIILDD